MLYQEEAFWIMAHLVEEGEERRKKVIVRKNCFLLKSKFMFLCQKKLVLLYGPQTLATEY